MTTITFEHTYTLVGIKANAKVIHTGTNILISGCCETEGCDYMETIRMDIDELAENLKKMDEAAIEMGAQETDILTFSQKKRPSKQRNM